MRVNIVISYSKIGAVDSQPTDAVVKSTSPASVTKSPSRRKFSQMRHQCTNMRSSFSTKEQLVDGLKVRAMMWGLLSVGSEARKIGLATI